MEKNQEFTVSIEDISEDGFIEPEIQDEITDVNIEDIDKLFTSEKIA